MPVLPAVLAVLLFAVSRDVRAAPDITMSIHGGGGGGGGGGNVGTADDRGQPSFTANQVHTLLSTIEFRLRDLSNTLRRDQQMERVNSRMDMMFTKLSHLEVSNDMWFDKFQQSVMEECGPNHMTRRLDKAQQQLEITLEHMETTLQTVQNHQKELEKEIRKVADKQTELSADIQSMRKDMNSEFDKHNSSQNAFKKQLQETVMNLSQPSKVSDRSLSSCSCNQNDDPSQIADMTTTNKLITTVNSMYNGLKERSDNSHILLKELFEITDKYRRRLDSDRHDVINEFLDSFLEAAVNEITTIQKKSENELEAKFKEHLQLLVDGQNLFMENCHRLQSNERQIENDMVLILERILDHIDNKTASEGTTLEQITKTLKALSSREEKMFTELSELGKTQSDQVTRTVAYSTNQVMKLHQDVMSMSNVLMAVNINGGISGPWNNSSVTSTDVAGDGQHGRDHRHNAGQNVNPPQPPQPPPQPTSRNRTAAERQTTALQQKPDGQSKVRGKPTTDDR